MKALRVILAGLGNIGSHLAGLAAAQLAPHPAAELVLVDPDAYEEKNLLGQDITRADLGVNKAEAQARRLRAKHPALRISAHACALQDLPLGEFHATTVLSGLDSMAARIRLSERVWQVSPLWVDAGVSADDRLARVSVFAPSRSGACIACGMDAATWARQSTRHLCTDTTATATNAPSALGALAASLAALELEKALAGDTEHLASGKEIVLSAKWHTHLVTTLGRDAACRAAHETLTVEPVDGVHVQTTTLAEFWAEHGDAGGALGIPGFPWSTMECCDTCGSQPEHLRLATKPHRTCARCGGVMQPLGFHLRECLRREELSPAQLATTLAGLGLRPREVTTFHRPDQTTRHLLLP